MFPELLRDRKFQALATTVLVSAAILLYWHATAAVQGEFDFKGGSNGKPPVPPTDAQPKPPSTEPQPLPEPRPNKGTRDWWKDY